MNKISGTDRGPHRELGTPLIPYEEEKKIFEETLRKLQTDTFVCFAFKKCEESVWLSRYISGEFNQKFLICAIEEAVRFYRLVQEGRKELFEKVKKDLETKEEGNDSIELFEIPLQEFSEAIGCIGADALRSHMLYARGLIEHLREELEEVGYLNAEYEKHGTGKNR